MACPLNDIEIHDLSLRIPKKQNFKAPNFSITQNPFIFYFSSKKSAKIIYNSIICTFPSKSVISSTRICNSSIFRSFLFLPQFDTTKFLGPSHFISERLEEELCWTQFMVLCLTLLLWTRRPDNYLTFLSLLTRSSRWS